VHRLEEAARVISKGAGGYLSLDLGWQNDYLREQAQ
jgi:hypothetical protein